MLTTQMLEIAIKEAKEKFVPGAILRMYKEENLYKIDFITKEGEFICLVGATNMFEVTVAICEAIANELKVYIQNDMKINDASSDTEEEDEDEDEEEEDENEEDLYSERVDRAAIEDDEKNTDILDIIAKALMLEYIKIVELKTPDSISIKLSCTDDKFMLEFVYNKFGNEYIELGHAFDNFKDATNVCNCLVEALEEIK